MEGVLVTGEGARSPSGHCRGILDGQQGTEPPNAHIQHWMELEFPQALFRLNSYNRGGHKLLRKDGVWTEWMSTGSGVPGGLGHEFGPCP